MDTTELINVLGSAKQQWSGQSQSAVDQQGTQDRACLLKAVNELRSVLENPQAAMIEIAKGPAAHAALRTALRLKVFEGWTAGSVKTIEDLAGETGAEVVLIGRIMRALVGIGICKEENPGTYEHNERSRTLLDRDFCTLITGMATTASLTMGKLPEYLASTSFRNPSDPEHSLFHFALNTNLNMFQWLRTQPQALALFTEYNAAATRIQGPSIRATISSLFPMEVTAQLYNGSFGGTENQEDDVLLVDIGCGQGNALSEVRQMRPDLRGRMIAQDLPEVVERRGEEQEGVENMAHNFLEPQPVKGARIYLLSHILHDWPTSTCSRILTNIISAMTPTYSRIVILDQVVPEMEAPAFSSMMDISMMTFGGMERTERQWRELLDRVGLTVVGMEGPRRGKLSGDGVVEAVWRG